MTKEKPIKESAKKRRILTLIAALAAAVAVVAGVLFLSNIGKKDLRADRGVLDLSGWTSDKQPFALRGEWAFYWEKLLTEEQASAVAPDAFTQDIPSVWNSYKVGGKKLPARGYGTYMLTVKNAPVGGAVP